MTQQVSLTLLSAYLYIVHSTFSNIPISSSFQHNKLYDDWNGIIIIKDLNFLSIIDDVRIYCPCNYQSLYVSPPVLCVKTTAFLCLHNCMVPNTNGKKVFILVPKKCIKLSNIKALYLQKTSTLSPRTRRQELWVAFSYPKNNT